MSEISQNDKIWSLVRVCIVFFVITSLLFLMMTLFVIVPKTDRTFETLDNAATKKASEVYARRLQQYLYYQILALNDIAADALIVNASLMGSNENPTLRDYIDHKLLLGRDPQLTLLDAVGEPLYSEIEENTDHSWSRPVLDEGHSQIIRIIESKHSPRFEIAVPIKYGAGTEGALIARVLASPNILYGKDIETRKNVAVSYSKNDKTIQSDKSGILLAHNETIELIEYGLVFVYTGSRQGVLQRKKEVLTSFVVSTILGSFALFIVLFFIGRKIIIRPFQELKAVQEAISSAVEGISRIDPEGRYITLNDAYANAAGYTPSELEGQPWSMTVCEEDMSLLNEAYKTMLKEGKVTAEARGVKKDGSIFYKQVTMISQYDNAGKFIGHHCFLKDISTKKLAEEKIQQQQQDLQLIFDNVPVKIWYKDDKNRILRLNKKAAESMGGKVKDFEGKDSYDLFPEMAKKYHDDDLVVIRSKKPKLNIVEKYTPVNGPTRWVSTDKIPYKDPETQGDFIFVCSQDITQLKEAELTKSLLISQLSDTNEELEKFAYIASHDLKSPLRGIEQLAGWIKEDCNELLPEKSKKHLGVMIKRVKRMGGLLDDLLAYSHISQLELLQDIIDLRSILDQLLDLHVQPFGFKVTLDVPDEKVVIPRKPLEIVLRNLLDNAVKHHHTGNGHITLKYTATEDSHIFDLSDDGPGIDPAMHTKAFAMFQTLKPRDAVEGSGMGLAIIKKILLRYDAEITISSDGQNGTHFKIIWPYNKKSTTIT